MADTAARAAPGWDCHVHVFDTQTPVRAGHYVPREHPLPAIEAVAAAHGIGHLVLVQPSVYGSDHRLLLQALRAGGGRHRGVAAADAAASDRELDELHAAGVRGVRFNLVSPAGHAGDPQAALKAVAPRLRERGWHVQWYVAPERLPDLAAWQADAALGRGLVFVLDHLAGLHATLPRAAPAWVAARALADRGAWVKLSGWYRLGASEPYPGLHDTLARVADWFGPRTVWGSDWPHTSFPPDRLPAYDSLAEPVRAALGEATLHAARVTHPPRLYDFPSVSKETA
ncbi:MAG: amidohydrolase family protein [Rubrivivax sp.]|nr:amidohydrolase family protein [Rubrivivax sp.]